VNALTRRGVTLACGALPPAVVTRWRADADALYARVDAAIAEAGPWAVADHLGLRFAPTASSLGLDALPGGAEIPALLLDALGETIEGALGGPARPLLEAAWLRRQFAPGRAPRWHAPHAWHQDGALGFDFERGDLAAGLLPMVTCWCPLVPCGVDAPALAIAPGRQGALLTLDALGGEHKAVEAPAMAPGDVLLMTGDLLHRTHVTPAMTLDRISVEVRFVQAG
jgi:hypothetical protein